MTVVQLPVSNKGAARSQSEMYYIDGTNFLLLPRDGSGYEIISLNLQEAKIFAISNGNGSPPAPSADDLTSKIKNIATFSIAGATNIANTQYDTPQVPVAPNGVLVASIVPAQVKNFISLIDNAQLSKATLQNGPPQISDIVGKYESKWSYTKATGRWLRPVPLSGIAVVSVLDAAAPDDYFVISVSPKEHSRSIHTLTVYRLSSPTTTLSLPQVSRMAFPTPTRTLWAQASMSQFSGKSTA